MYLGQYQIVIVTYTEPLVVYKYALNFSTFRWILKVKYFNGIFHFNRLQQAFLRTKGQECTLEEIKQIIYLGTRISEQNRFV